MFELRFMVCHVYYNGQEQQQLRGIVYVGSIAMDYIDRDALNKEDTSMDMCPCVCL